MTTSNRMLFIGLAVAAFLISVYVLKPILTPFIIAMLIAYLGNPLTEKIQSFGVSRSWAASLVFLVIALFNLALIIFLTPKLVSQVDLLRELIPKYVVHFRENILPAVGGFFGVEDTTKMLQQMQATLENNWERASDVLAKLLSGLGKSGMSIVGWLGSVALIPVVAFYLLRDWNILIGHVRDLLPRYIEDTVVQLAGECDEVLGAFLRGQLMIMLCSAFIYTIGLSLIGLDLALIVGVVSGIAAVVPYFGAVLGIALASFAAIVEFGDLFYLLPVVAVFLVGQSIESMILTPILVGDKIGLHPVAVILAVLIGGQLYGFVGVLLALPVAAILMVLLRHAHKNYTNSVFYHNETE